MSLNCQSYNHINKVLLKSWILPVARSLIGWRLRGWRPPGALSRLRLWRCRSQLSGDLIIINTPSSAPSSVNTSSGSPGSCQDPHRYRWHAQWLWCSINISSSDISSSRILINSVIHCPICFSDHLLDSVFTQIIFWLILISDLASSPPLFKTWTRRPWHTRLSAPRHQRLAPTPRAWWQQSPDI